jgi:Glycosyl transferase family 2
MFEPPFPASGVPPGARETPAAHAVAGRRIALVMIVRDEARAIERCLRSAAPFVDEMVVLDTGSRDDTPERARACGARVEHFTWCDDFAAARNAALACTQADWRLVLDADEWLDSGGACLAGLREQPGGFVGQIEVISIDAAGTLAPSWLPRLLPRGACYHGRIHEQPDLGLPRTRWPLSVRHDGYLQQQMARKAGRNRHLLERSLAEQPDDAYLRYQLGKDHEVRDEFADAAVHYRRAERATRARRPPVARDTTPAGLHSAWQGLPPHSLPDAPPAEPHAASPPWRHDLVVRLLFTLKRLGALDEACALAAAEQAAWRDSPDFHFTLGDLWLECAIRAPARAAEWLPRIEASWLRAIEIGERPDLNDSVRGRGSWLAAHNLAVYYRSLGRSDQADDWEHSAAEMRTAGARRPAALRSANSAEASLGAGVPRQVGPGTAEQRGALAAVPAFDPATTA